SYKNISTFFLAYMSEEGFAELGETNCQYLVRYSGDDDRYSENDEKDFRKAVNEKYHMHSYTAAEENQDRKSTRLNSSHVSISYAAIIILSLHDALPIFI